MAIRSALILPDKHVPDHNKRHMAIAFEVGAYLGISELVDLGDMADFYSLMNHQKDPRIYRKLSKEVEAVNHLMDLYETVFPKAKKVFIQGNHEYRLERYLKNTAPELFGLVKCEDLFYIKERKNWEWVPYTASQVYQILNSKLYARHEPIGTSAKTTAQRAMKNIVFGHTHRVESAEVVAIDGEPYRAWSCGWLGDISRPAFDYVKNHHQWASGFGIAYITNDGNWWGETVRIIKNKAVVAGKVFKG